MNNQPSPDFNRRDFLRQTSLASLMAFMGGIELRAENAAAPAAAPAYTAIPVGPTVNYGVIGLGVWGREIVNTLSQLPNAPVLAICDTYASMVRRTAEAAPKAETFDDYTKLLAKKEIQAVIVATPTHLHKEIVLAALQAGKHVYCEAPIAFTVEDAREIAQAAKKNFKSVFQVGLQARSHPQHDFLLPFIRAGAIGKNVMARAQWHQKQSWARVAPTPEREKALNWRLRSKTSLGLIGEIGIHQLDTMAWYLKARPTAVTGFGSNILWQDGRDVPDTIQATIEFPEGVNLIYDASLCTQFDLEYETYHGTDATVMLREHKAWMFKEVDSPLLGWEVYARKDSFYKETGIALVANATKSTVTAKQASDSAYPFSPLYYALENFTSNIGVITAATEDFISSFGDSDPQALADHLAERKKKHAAGWQEGYEATVLAIKANEAILKKQRIVLEPALFEI